MNWLTEPWLFPFMRWALLCCLILTSIHVYLGFHIVRRGVLFVDLAMAQAAALGAAFGVLIGIEHDTAMAYVLSASFALASAAFFALVRSRRIHQEAIVAAFYGLASAATFVVLERSPHGMEEVKHLFVGQILTVSPARVLSAAAAYVVIGIAHAKMHSRTMALTEGRESGRMLDFFFFATFALVVTISVGLAGVLLVFALLVLPAIASILVTRKKTMALVAGWGFAGAASVVGLHIAYHMDMPAAPMIVLMLGALLLGAVVVSVIRPDPD